MARRRFEQLPRERRDEILRIAAAEFARSGFHGTSYNQLLERLQLGKSSAYYYFDDKRDLFVTAVNDAYARFFGAVRHVEHPTSAKGFWAYVERTMRFGYDFMLEDPTAADLMMCLQREKALLGELGSSELLDSIEAFYAEMLRAGQQLGAVRTDLPFELVVALVRDTAMTFDRWFITARAREASAPSPVDCARWFTETVQRLCRPA